MSPALVDDNHIDPAVHPPPRTMKAVQLKQANDVYLVESETPTLNEGELLIKVHATSINPSDILNITGGFPYTTYPRVPGRDFAGTVVDGPANFVGKEVFGTSGRTLGFTKDGPHAEYVVVPAGGVAGKPSNMSFVQASTVGVPFTTASMALRRGRARKGDYVLVLGATGAVGSSAVQLATSLGCKILTASRKDVTDINLVQDPTLTKVKSLTNDKGADIIIDTTGDLELMAAALGALAHGGRLVFIAAPRRGSTTSRSISRASIGRNRR